MQTLLDALGIEQFALLTRRTGYRFGLSLCHAAPDRVRQFVACAPALPARNTDDYEQMNPFARFISVTALRHPTLLAFVARAGMRYINTHGLRAFAQVINKACPQDLAVIDQDQHWQVMETGMAFSSRHGHRTYLKEAEHDAADVWDQTVQAPLPITVLIGEHDPNARRARTDALNAAGARLDVVTLADAGQLFFYTQPEAVLDTLQTA